MYGLIHASVQLDVKRIAHQIICGVHWMHSAGIIHRDITPTNILVDINGQAKICDFGNACALSSDEAEYYLTSRAYRAPELLMKKTNYNESSKSER